MADFYVKTTGTRSSGESTPGDWSDANCYPTIKSAATLAAGDQNDSLVLYRETHTINNADGVASLPGGIYNQDKDTDYSDCIVSYASDTSYDGMQNTANLVVKGITIQDAPTGMGRAALKLNNSSGSGYTINIDSCYFYNNKGRSISGGAGSAIECTNTSGKITLNITNSVFTANHARNYGNAVYGGDNVEINVATSVFASNLPEGGVSLNKGTIAAVSPTIKSTLNITDTVFLDNITEASGAAVYCADADLTVDGTVFDGNKNYYQGLAGTTSGCTIMCERNTATGADTTFTMTDSTVQNSLMTNGGAAGAGDGTVLSIGLNPANKVIATVSGCTFQDNFSIQGGGYYMGRYSTGTVDKCKFYRNTSAGGGGGFYKGGANADCLGETALVTNCLFAENMAGYAADRTTPSGLSGAWGGGIGTRLYPRVDARNNSFYNNVSTLWGHSMGMFDDSGTFDADGKRCSAQNNIFYSTASSDEVRVYNDSAGNYGFTMFSNNAYKSGAVTLNANVSANNIVLPASPYISETNLQLADTSSCRNTGADVGITSDYLGRRVPIGPAPDLGAYENSAFDQIQTPSAASVPYADNISVLNRKISQEKLIESTT